MNEFAKKLALKAASVLPMNLRWSLARSLVDGKEFGAIHGLTLLSAMAPHLPIDGLRTRGDYGVIVGSPSDKVIFRQYAETGRWAAGTNQIIERFFDRHDAGTYVDVGANIGLTTIPIAQRPSVQCVAIEPEPVNFSHLTLNVQANCPHRNVTLWNRAAFDRKSTLDFELSPDNLGDHRIRSDAGRQVSAREGEGARDVITVQAEPLDDLVVENGPLALKIDTQGAEPFVVGGARRLLGKAELLIIEFAPYLMKRMGGDPEALLSMLERNFSVGRITGAESTTHSMAANESMTAVCARLRSMISKAEGSPSIYVDVIAEKA